MYMLLLIPKIPFYVSQILIVENNFQYDAAMHIFA
jgi:hypothetical protein